MPDGYDEKLTNERLTGKLSRSEFILRDTPVPPIRASALHQRRLSNLAISTKAIACRQQPKNGTTPRIERLCTA